MMKHVAEVGLIVGWLFFIAGCFQVDTVLKINKDGSGTIQKKLLMSEDSFMAGLEQMSSQMGVELEKSGKSDQDKTKFDIFDEDSLKKEAASMGEDVVYLSSKKISKGKFSGYEAVYKFPDVNKINLNQSPKTDAPLSGTSTPGKESAEDLLTFHFTKGNPSVLVIKKGITVKAKEKEPASQSPNPSTMTDQQLSMITERIKQMFKDMKLSMRIEVQGKIVETNATHRKGPDVTLMDLDFNKLTSKPEKLKKFAQVQPNSLDDAMELLKDLPDFKVELQDEVVIKFK